MISRGLTLSLGVACAALLAGVPCDAHAGPLAIEAGGGALVLDTPGARGGASTDAVLAIAARIEPDARLPVALHVAVAVGARAPELGARVLGVLAPVLEKGRVRVEIGPALVGVHGESSALGDALVPGGVGAALDVRASIAIGERAGFAIVVLPTWVFASDAVATEASVRSALAAYGAVTVTL